MTGRGGWGCLAILAYPIVEVAIAAVLASFIGWWWVFVLIVVFIVLGLGLMRYALGATGRSFGVAMSSLRAPDGEQLLMIEGGAPQRPLAPPAQTLLIVPAGLLIAVPGFLTTALGLVLWLPPVRSRIAQRIERAARRMPPPSAGPTDPMGPMGPMN